MSVVHDAYIFHPSEFVASMVELVSIKGRGWSVSYPELREKALAAYRRNPTVVQLADRYGGWDERTLLDELPAFTSSALEDSLVWMSLLLYDSLMEQSVKMGLGLGDRWRETEAALSSAGWSPGDVRLAIHGHRLVALLAGNSRPELLIPLQHGDLRLLLYSLRPPSTASSAGWLSFHDAAVMQQRLAPMSVQSDCLRLLECMADAAVRLQAALCIIKSG